jgi:two-component system sensor histidine kinase KdpD
MHQGSGESERPDPDALLREIERAERPQGKLKVFLGYSPGVGKTYSMLLEARIRRRRGDDIVVGVVETHGRSETEALVQGLEVAPRLVGDYNGIRLDEMDLDAILARRPELVLVDELAHSNAPWCRHSKRYQDVEEILKAGIDVYTTLNVQHLEGQKDVVARITGIEMHETVPDWVVDAAEEIQVIDIPLEELFDRLREGKVYIPAEASRAMERFFQRGHLVALREITLNVVARKMDNELLNYRKARSIGVPWPATEKLMVCVGATEDASDLVRKAYRLAKEKNAEWYAVHVAVPVLGELSAVSQAYLADALNLAEEFGAHTVTLSETDVVPALLRFARENNVSQIVLRRPRQLSPIRVLRSYMLSALLRDESGFDLFLLSAATGETRAPAPQARYAPGRQAQAYVLALLVLGAATGLNLLIEPYANPTSLYAIYLFATVVVALLFGLGPSICTAVLSFLAFDLLFIEPRFALAIQQPADLVGALVFLVTSIAVGQLIQVSRRQSAALRVKIERSSLLEEMGKELLSISPAEGTDRRERDLDQIARTTLRYVITAVHAPAVVLLRAPADRLQVWGQTEESLSLKEEEMAVAEWVRAHGEEAGAGTGTLASTTHFFIPMKHGEETVGVIGIRVSAEALLPEQRRMLQSIAGLAALSASRWTGGSVPT